jgi:hypothetical protein
MTANLYNLLIVSVVLNIALVMVILLITVYDSEEYDPPPYKRNQNVRFTPAENNDAYYWQWQYQNMMSNYYCNCGNQNCRESQSTNDCGRTDISYSDMVCDLNRSGTNNSRRSHDNKSKRKRGYNSRSESSETLCYPDKSSNFTYSSDNCSVCSESDCD